MAYPSVSANSPPFPVMPTRCREDSQNGENGRSNNNKYHISLEALLSGEERRKTVMLRNIPNSFSQKTLLSILTSIIPASYEFVYMPVVQSGFWLRLCFRHAVPDPFIQGGSSSQRLLS